MFGKRSFSVSVLVTIGESWSSAHALDYDIICEGVTQEIALRKLKVAVTAYLEYAITHGQLDNLDYPAPAEYWQMLDSIEGSAYNREPVGTVAQNPLNLFWAMMHGSGKTAEAVGCH